MGNRIRAAVMAAALAAGLLAAPLENVKADAELIAEEAEGTVEIDESGSGAILAELPEEADDVVSAAPAGRKKLASSFASNAAILDSSYTSSNLSAVKNQGSSTLCWAVSMQTLNEMSLGKQGIAEGADLSEMQLGYTTYKTEEKAGGTEGFSANSPLNWYTIGGNPSFAASSMMENRGMGPEASYPFDDYSDSYALSAEQEADAAYEADAILFLADFPDEYSQWKSDEWYEAVGAVNGPFTTTARSRSSSAPRPPMTSIPTPGTAPGKRGATGP